MAVIFLPPASEVCEGYTFTGVCLSRGGVSAPLYAEIHPLGRHPPPSGQTPPRPVHTGIHTPCPVHAGIHPPCAVHARIRSTSKRYASHWNAFLFGIAFRSHVFKHDTERTLRKKSIFNRFTFLIFCLELLALRKNKTKILNNHDRALITHLQTN